MLFSYSLFMGKRMKKDDLLEPFNSAINGCFLQDIGRIHAYSDIQYYHPIVSLLKITNHLDKLSPMLLSSLLLFFSLIQLIVLGAGMLSPDLAQLGQIPCFYALHGVYMVFMYTFYSPCSGCRMLSSLGSIITRLSPLFFGLSPPSVPGSAGRFSPRLSPVQMSKAWAEPSSWRSMGWEHVGTSPLNHKPLVKNHHFR